MTRRVLVLAPALAIGCSHGTSKATSDAPVQADAACTTCDSDGDGVPDSSDQCPSTPAGATVNMVGCADSQLTPVLGPAFPPYGLTWVSSGELGRAGGLTWTYTGIDRGDLFHIYWVFCDDPAEPCGLSLDGPIDPATESWQYDQTMSNLAEGKLVFDSTTHIVMADGSTPQLSTQLTVNIAGPNQAPMYFTDVGTFHIKARDGIYAAEIPGTGFEITAEMDVQDPASQAWTPYLDFYDAQQKPDLSDAGGDAYVSFGGTFYDK